jgi:amino acid adenylation domain-containing protein
MIQTLLAELGRSGVKLRLSNGDRLEVIAPRGGLTTDLREAITQSKPELLAWLRNAPGPDQGLPTIVADPARAGEPFSPSDLQTSFLIGSRPGFEYHVRPHQYAEWDMAGIEPDRLVEALNRVIWNMRANLFVVRDDLLLAPVGEPAPLSVPIHDLRGLPAGEAEQRIVAVRESMVRTELPLGHWPWLELQISRPSDDSIRLHYNNNNFFIDAIASGRFLQDILHAYEHPDEQPEPLAIGYRDCVLALAELETSELGLASKKYWCDRMADWPTAPPIPLVAGAQSRRRSLLDRREFVLPAELWAALKQKAGARGLTPTNLLYAVYAEVLATFSGSRHFLINNMITHRLPLHPQIGDVPGQFASLYPLEIDWRPDEPFTDRVRRLRRQVTADMDHVYWSGVKVLQELNRQRHAPGRAVCPFVIGSALFAGPTDRPVYSRLETPQTLLDCELWELGDGALWVVWDVIEAMFPPGLMDGMHAASGALLTLLATDDDAWLQHSFDLLPADQRARRAALNASAPAAAGRLLQDYPPQPAGKLAVIGADTALSYGDLDRRCGVLARRLQEHGVTSGDLVAVVLPKSPDQVTAVLSALRAGGSYVPIDPQWPAERIRLLLADAGVSAALTSEALLGELTGLSAAPMLAVDAWAGHESSADVPGNDVPRPVDRGPEDLAYVIYTSGSTGRPKGAMLDHRGPVNTVTDINARFGIGSDDVVFGVSSLCFDLSVYDVFGTLAAGATLVMPPPGSADPMAWIDLVTSTGVTVWNSVPAIMQLFAEEAAAAGASFPALRVVLLSGDWIPVDLPGQIRKIAPNARVISLGGATEASIWSIHHPIDEVPDDWVSIPYGRPLAGQTWHVLDGAGRDAPDWVPGPLYIGGVGVALGYLGDAVRTEAAFVTHPQTGERLYRTGDLGRYRPDGEIEFLGRADFQVKIQGFRVEPGEVEHVLLEHPQVGRAAVVARASGSGRQLSAFVVSEVDEVTLRAYLVDRLPSYLVPSHLVVLDELPLTGNGKLDRKALEALGPAEDRATRTPTPPRTPTEVALAEIWSAVLGLDEIGIHDDFFELGGQSFAALRMSSLLAARLGRRVPLGTLLDRRTIAELSDWLDLSIAEWSALARLSEAVPGRPPWFLVHPAGGDVLCYRGLAELLDRPVHAFQAPGPACGRVPLTQVADFADLYLPELLAAQPAGPYRIGGWSSGAVIAFELAARLERLGHQVERVLVLDSPAPIEGRAVDDVTALLWFLEDLDVGFDLGAVAAADLDALATGYSLEAALELAAAQGIDVSTLHAADLMPTFAVFLGVVRACNTYQPPTVSAPITVIRALGGSVPEFAGHPHAESPDWGWSTLTSATTICSAVSGTHHTLLGPAQVRTVAATIEQGER